MKKLCVILVSIMLLTMFLSISSMAENSTANNHDTLEVVVNGDGSITVTTHGRFSPKGDEVCIYKSSDVIDTTVDIEDRDVNPLPIVSWIADDGVEITYPVKAGKFDHIPVGSSFRVEELQNGYAGSALRPGKYYAVVLSGVNFYQFVTEPVPFEIPEMTATPEPTANVTPTPSHTDVTPPNPSNSSMETPSKDRNMLLWISIAVAAVAVITITTIVIIRKIRS